MKCDDMNEDDKGCGMNVKKMSKGSAMRLKAMKKSKGK